MSEGAQKKAGEQRKLKLLIKRALLMKYFVTFLYSDFDHLVELTLLIRSQVIGLRFPLDSISMTARISFYFYLWHIEFYDR